MVHITVMPPGQVRAWRRRVVLPVWRGQLPHPSCGRLIPRTAFRPMLSTVESRIDPSAVIGHDLTGVALAGFDWRGLGIAVSVPDVRPFEPRRICGWRRRAGWSSDAIVTA